MPGLKRPYVTTKENIKVGITLGGELMFGDTLQEYFGEYHVYPNNAFYSDAEYNPQTSRELLPLIRPLQAPQCKTYLQLTKKLFSQHTAPTNHFVTVTPEDYQNGTITRYFIQKINEPFKIYEVNPAQFKALNTSNQPGPNGRIYRRDLINWTIVGDVNTLRAKNSFAIQTLERSLPGIGTYVLTDPTEFAKITYTGAQNNLFTAGGLYTDSNANNYIGTYHIRANGDVYQGPREISGINRQLFPVK